MYRHIIVIVLFAVGLFREIQEIISFEKTRRQSKDEEFVKLFRKCHWTYLLIFAACIADRIIALFSMSQQ